MKLLFLFFVGLCCQLNYGRAADSTCGYQSCHTVDPTTLNVHLVPHTHDDVGWLKTVDQYYYGANNTIQKASVQYILDTVVQQLLSDPTKRFIYVEIAFFSRWWIEQSFLMKENVKILVEQAYTKTQRASVQYILDTVYQQLMVDPKRKFIYVEIAFFKRWFDEQTDIVKQNVVMLVNEGRLEFILGGWCMNDEAATHYNAIIDQMTLGLRFLNETFGACARPRVAWQIDPFGHSREQASLFAQMGFDGLFFGRLDFEDKENREKTRNMEEIWRGSESLVNPTADLFTGVNENGYGPPSGFCFDEYCDDQPIMDDPKLEDNNVAERVHSFIDAAKIQAKHFKTNHIMMTMGSDFQYSNAVMWYKNLDKLINYVNLAEANVTVFYSTPSCYLYALNKANQEWNVKTDDFFPYAEVPHSFWTGYFTSRPGLKGYVRNSNNFLQVCNQIEVFSQLQTSKNLKSSSAVITLREAMGVVQHHDAVSGTSKQHVANDYAKRLYEGRKSCKALISEAITGTPSDIYFCDYLNVSICNYTQFTSPYFHVLAYNPLTRTVETYIRFPVDTLDPNDLQVIDLTWNLSIPLQVTKVSESTSSVRRNRGNAVGEVVFWTTLPALGYNEYQIRYMKKSNKKTNLPKEPKEDLSTVDKNITIKNMFYEVNFDATTGLMTSLTNVMKNIQIPISNNLFWYNGSMGNNISHQQSGAYVFRPNSSHVFSVASNNKVETTLLQGDTPEVQEVYQKFSDWAYQTVRLYTQKAFVEIEWTIGPIPIKDGLGKEIISRFDTDIKSDGLFYTDANGREILERKYNYRPTWTLNQSEPVAGNYYPVNSRIYLKDQTNQLTVLTDRSQGGASLKNGSLELMIHRRLLGEDGKGVGEPLNETGQFGDGLIVRGKHWLLLDTVMSSAQEHRDLAEEIFMAPMLMFKNVSEEVSTNIELGSMLNFPLQDQVHLLTLQTTNDGFILIRLEHKFQKDEHPDYVTVNIKTMFENFTPTYIEELLLGGNVKKSDVTRMDWTATGRQKRDTNQVLQFERPYPFPVKEKPHEIDDPFKVVLQPMEIRTFLIK